MTEDRSTFSRREAISTEPRFRALKAPAVAGAVQAERPRPTEEMERSAVRRGAAQDRDRQPRQGWRPGPIKAARFPAHQTLKEFDFTFQRSLKRTDVLHLGRLDFLPGCERSTCSVRAAPEQRARRSFGEIFGDELTATALIDRLVHAEILSLPPQRPATSPNPAAND
jgi:hypothetical protein